MLFKSREKARNDILFYLRKDERTFRFFNKDGKELIMLLVFRRFLW